MVDAELKYLYGSQNGGATFTTMTTGGRAGAVVG